MSNLRKSSPARTGDEISREYHFDYSKARSNRFAPENSEKGRVVELDPDVARVFTTPESVNSVLRALIATMPHTDNSDEAA